MVFVLCGCVIGSVLLSVMIRDTVAEIRHLLTSACDLWLEAREIKIPASLYSQIERVKRDAAAAKDKETVRIVTDQFLAMTKKLAVKDRKEYESQASPVHAEKVASKPGPKRVAPKNSSIADFRIVGLRATAHPRDKRLKSESASA
jgi:hypothetical protein